MGAPQGQTESGATRCRTELEGVDVEPSRLQLRPSVLEQSTPNQLGCTCRSRARTPGEHALKQSLLHTPSLAVGSVDAHAR